MIINHRRLLTQPGFRLYVASMMINYPVFIKPGLAWDYKSPVYIWIAPLESCAHKSLDYIIQIFNSQHGWILLWLSITSIMIKVFKVALAQRLLFYERI